MDGHCVLCHCRNDVGHQERAAVEATGGNETSHKTGEATCRRASAREGEHAITYNFPFIRNIEPGAFVAYVD